MSPGLLERLVCQIRGAMSHLARPTGVSTWTWPLWNQGTAVSDQRWGDCGRGPAEALGAVIKIIRPSSRGLEGKPRMVRKCNLCHEGMDTSYCANNHTVGKHDLSRRGFRKLFQVKPCKQPSFSYVCSEVMQDKVFGGCGYLESLSKALSVCSQASKKKNKTYATYSQSSLSNACGACSLKKKKESKLKV